MAHSDNEEAQLQQAIAMSLQNQAGGAGTSTPLTYNSEPAKAVMPQIDGQHENDLETYDRQPFSREPYEQSESPLFMTNEKRDTPQASLKRTASASSVHSLASGSEGRPAKKPRDTVMADVVETTEFINVEDSPPLEDGTQSPACEDFIGPGGYPIYPHGAIKKTWVFGTDRANDIKIGEVLQVPHLKQVVLSTWQFDTEWWAGMFNWRTGPRQVWVIGAKDAATRESFAQGPKETPLLRICFPPMQGVANMNHSKFMLLSYPDHLRIVVTTANMTRYDWGETGAMENSVFLIDLPRLAEPLGSVDELTFFGQELVHYLMFIGLDKSLASSLLKFDFSETKEMAFVHSLAGLHTDEAMQRTGFLGLGRAVRELGLESHVPPQLDYATSSMGALRPELLLQLYRAASGRGEDDLPSGPIVSAGSIMQYFRIYFPTKETVAQSIGGTKNAGTITFNKKYFEAAGFPKAALRDHVSQRTGILSHNKILLARGQRAGELGQDEGTNVAWAYVGSANLTESAWGRMSTDRRTKREKLSCRNYECGVLVAVPRERANADFEAKKVPGMDVFEGTLDIPFKHPSAAFGKKLPWFEHLHG